MVNSFRMLVAFSPVNSQATLDSSIVARICLRSVVLASDAALSRLFSSSSALIRSRSCWIYFLRVHQQLHLVVRFVSLLALHITAWMHSLRDGYSFGHTTRMRERNRLVCKR